MREDFSVPVANRPLVPGRSPASPTHRAMLSGRSQMLVSEGNGENDTDLALEVGDELDSEGRR